MLDNSGVKKMQHAKELQSIMQAGYHFRAPGAFIAGGALTSAFTGQPIHDVDYYFKTKEAFCEAVAIAYDGGLWCVHYSDRAVTFANCECIVQLMHFDFFETPADIFDAFDFTCNMAAFDLDANEFVFHDDFLKHASQRYLSFHAGTRYPFGTITRVLKYQARGYTIGKGDMLRIALACHKVPLVSWDDVSKAIGGQYGEPANLEAAGDFSIDAAIEAIANIDIDKSIKASAKPDIPGNAEALLALIGMGETDA